MNSAVRRFIIFFFSLATLTACEDPTDIGIDLQDDFQIGTDFTDTLTINTGTVLLNDSILAFNQAPLVGFMADPYLGTLRATHFTEIGLGGSDLKFGEAPVADSLVLTLDYNFLYSKNANTLPLTLNVHELTQGFQEKESYFTNSPALNYSAEPLGSITITPILERKEISKGVYADSARLIRMKLPQQLAQRIIEQSGKAALANQANFSDFLKGFAFVVPGNSPSTIVGIYTQPNATIKSNRTALTLYYKDGTGNDAAKSHAFLFNSTMARSFTKLTADRSGTAIADLQAKYQYISSEQTNGETYIQAGTQLLTKLTIPHLKKLKEQQGEFVINRAELIVPVKPGTIAFDDTVFLNFAPPMQLAMFETNQTNRILRTADGTRKTVQMDLTSSSNSYNFPTVLTYNPRKEHYAVNITSYVQDILAEKKPNNGILLAPASISTSAAGNQLSQDIRPLRAILNNTDAKGAKLRIYFSKLN